MNEFKSAGPPAGLSLQKKSHSRSGIVHTYTVRFKRLVQPHIHTLWDLATQRVSVLFP